MRLLPILLLAPILIAACEFELPPETEVDPVLAEEPSIEDPILEDPILAEIEAEIENAETIEIRRFRMQLIPHCGWVRNFDTLGFQIIVENLTDRPLSREDLHGELILIAVKEGREETLYEPCLDFFPEDPLPPGGIHFSDIEMPACLFQGTWEFTLHYFEESGRFDGTRFHRVVESVLSDTAVTEVEGPVVIRGRARRAR